MTQFFLSSAVEPQPVAEPQLCIDFDAVRACRSSDPETSKAAAKNASTFATTQAGRVHAALKTHGQRSAHELSLLIGLTVVQIDRRLPDLLRANLARVVTLDDGAVLVRHGCRVWEAT